MPLYVTEYARMPRDAEGKILPVGEEPALAAYTVAIGGTSVQSAGFNSKTHFVRLHTDAICSVKFGADPTAVTDENRMPADATEFFGVVPGHRVAVITNT